MTHAMVKPVGVAAGFVGGWSSQSRVRSRSTAFLICL
jgi:hypothetical protein